MEKPRYRQFGLKFESYRTSLLTDRDRQEVLAALAALLQAAATDGTKMEGSNEGR